ncbi:MAG: hypothetical protein Q9211_000991 [Gyalolechia sp. 1 TL-2023]
MARDNNIEADELSIEPVGTLHDKHSRSVKTKLFRWQAVTAGICLLARSSLLYFWTKHTLESLQQDNNLILDPANIHLQSIVYGPKAAFRPRLRISGPRVPKVDVLIFYCGEELAILLDTVRAACSSNYPQEKFRVTVLDDSNSAFEPIVALKSQFHNLFYSARKSKDKAWHKAGNINHGLQFVATLSGSPYELVAGLDVDMIPERDWLRCLAPHLCLDRTVGLVSSNQRFYNVPCKDPLGQLLQFDQLQFVRQLRKDFGGIGLGGGTGWMASRVALDTIGGFAVDSISEDFLTCVDMMEAGWTVALLDEDLQWGLVPESFNGHTKQIQRWTTAMLSFYQALSSGSSRRKHQRAFQVMADFSTIAYVLGMNMCYFGVPLLVLSGYPLIIVDNRGQLRTMVALSFMDFVAQSAQGFLESASAEFNIYTWHETSHLWHAPLYVGPLLRRWFPRFAAITVGKVLELSPGLGAANKSLEDQHTSPWKRLKVVCTECSVLPHFFVLGMCVAGALLFFNDIFQHTHANDDMIWWYIITHLGYPPALFLWSSALWNSCTPFWYALFVPPRVGREKLSIRDEKSGIVYPKKEAKDQNHRRVNEWHLVLNLAYSLGVLVSSRWL